MDSTSSPRLQREFSLPSKYRTLNNHTVISRCGLVLSRIADRKCKVLIIDTNGKNGIRIGVITDDVLVRKITGDGRKIICRTQTDGLAVWDVEALSMDENQPLYYIDRCDVDVDAYGKIEISNDNKTVFLRTDDNEVRAYNLEDGTPIVTSAKDTQFLVLIGTPGGESLYATFRPNEKPGVGCWLEIFNLHGGERKFAVQFQFKVRSISDTLRGNVFLMIIHNSHTKNVCLAELTIETSATVTVRDLITVDCTSMTLYTIVYSETSDGAIFAYSLGNGCIILADSNGNHAQLSGIPSGHIEMEFSSDGRDLIIRDPATLRVYDVFLFPFWSIILHPRFKGEQKKCIKALFYANRISPKKRRRERNTFLEIPREIMLHILSFVRRDY